MHVIDLSSSRNMSETSTIIQCPTQILQISLNQAGASTERKVAILDKNRDLQYVEIKAPHKSFQKLGGQVQSFQWNSQENMLTAIQDTRLVVWYCPTACFDRDLLKMCSMQYDSHELGRSPRINDFIGSSVWVRRADGSLLNVPISPFPALLHKYYLSVILK